MKIKKIALMLVIVLSFSMLSSTTVFAASTDKTTTIDKANFQKQLDIEAAKLGVKAVILNNVDPSTITLKFDTIEDFDKAIGTLHVKTNVKTAPISNQNGNIKINPMTFTGTFVSNPHPVWLGSYEIIGWMNQKVMATEYWNSDYQKNLFSQILSHTAYISQGVGFSYTPDPNYPYEHSIIDGGRTIEANSYGNVTLGVKIGDYVAGFEWPFNMADDFLAV